jgi:hypothetical protein
VTFTGSVNLRKARLYFDDQKPAYAVWLALPKGTRAAFSGANDETPVYPWDCVDKF